MSQKPIEIDTENDCDQNVVVVEPLSLDDDSEAMNSMVTLISYDQEKIQIKKKAALGSDLLRTCIEFDTNCEEIPVNVHSEILTFIVEWLNYYEKSNPNPLPEPIPIKKTFKEICSDYFCYQFCYRIAGAELENHPKTAKNKNRLYKAIEASNYMIVKSLYKYLGGFIASMLKGQPLEEMMDIVRGECDPFEEKCAIEYINNQSLDDTIEFLYFYDDEKLENAKKSMSEEELKKLALEKMREKNISIY